MQFEILPINIDGDMSSTKFSRPWENIFQKLRDSTPMKTFSSSIDNNPHKIGDRTLTGNRYLQILQLDIVRLIAKEFPIKVWFQQDAADDGNSSKAYIQRDGSEEKD